MLGNRKLGGALLYAGALADALASKWKHDMTDLGVMGTGVFGLDDVLTGGLTRGRVFLLEGEPGSGKTTIALQFLMDGAKAGEQSLYITLSETEEELRQGAASHGWALGPEINVFELLLLKACSTKSSNKACSIPPI